MINATIERGLLAGAAGTIALDAFTYGDILTTARPQSTLPAVTVKKLAERANLSPLARDDGEAPKNRRSGAGALLGYGVGLGAGIAYAAMRPALRALPWPAAGVVLGLSTLLVSEGSSNALGATDWSQWTPGEWAMDIVPRSIYGLVTAYVVERFLEHDDASIEPSTEATAVSLSIDELTSSLERGGFSVAGDG